MAPQSVGEFVVSQTDIAVFAHRIPVANLALEYRSVSSPVLKKNSLFTPGNGFSQFIEERFGENTLHLPRFQLLAEINNRYFGHFHAAEPVPHFDQPVFA